MSLSTWLRDYLFVPLGGSRSGEWSTARNLMLTMTLGGLWHGASWTFVVWGLYHGLLLVGHRAFRRFCESRPAWASLWMTIPGTILRWMATLLAVTGWVDDAALGGWPAVVVGYPAAVTVPLAFATMVAVSRFTRTSVPADVSRIFARMHLPERLGMGVERVPRG